MKRWIFRVVLLATLVLAGYLAKVTVFAPEPVPVRLVEAAVGNVESTVTNSRAGTIKVRQRAKLSPQIGGRVLQLPFREGSTIAAGDLLLRLDGEVQKAQVQLANKRVSTARARHAEICLTAERTQQEFERNEQLAERKIISDDQLDAIINRRDRAVLACASAEALVDESQAARDLAQAQYAQTELYAPFAGVLAKLDVEIGEYVTPAPPGVLLPSVIDLIDPGSTYLSAPMDEVDSAVIAVGMGVRVTIDPFPDQEFVGRVARIAPFVLDMEAQNRTIEIEVNILDKNLADQLLPGTSADVEVILLTAENVLRIPTSTLLEGGRVLLFDGETIQERRVQVGLRNWNWVEITGGLRAGERVVTNLGDLGVSAGAQAVLAEEL